MLHAGHTLSGRWPKTATRKKKTACLFGGPKARPGALYAAVCTWSTPSCQRDLVVTHGECVSDSPVLVEQAYTTRVTSMSHETRGKRLTRATAKTYFCDFKIAIRSYKRCDMLGEYTLRVLEENDIPPSKIFIFVGSDDIQQYREKYARYTIVRCPAGTSNCNIKIRSFFGPRAYVIQMDDDIASIRTVERKGGANRLGAHTCLADLFAKGYADMLRSGATIWGVYPVPNALWMKPNWTTFDLRFLIGHLFGFINDGIDCGRDNYRDDYERTILRFHRDGAVVRYNDVSCNALIFQGAGGLAETRTPALMNSSADYMMAQYPQYVRIKKYSKPRPWKEIRLIRTAAPLRPPHHEKRAAAPKRKTPGGGGTTIGSDPATGRARRSLRRAGDRKRLTCSFTCPQCIGHKGPCGDLS